MKVKFPDNHKLKGKDAVMYGVEFKKGVAELSKEEVAANVFEKLLERYCGVVKATGPKKKAKS